MAIHGMLPQSTTHSSRGERFNFGFMWHVCAALVRRSLWIRDRHKWIIFSTPKKMTNQTSNRKQNVCCEWYLWCAILVHSSIYAERRTQRFTYFFLSPRIFFLLFSHFNTPPYILQLELMISALRERARRPKITQKNLNWKLNCMYESRRRTRADTTRECSSEKEERNREQTVPHVLNSNKIYYSWIQNKHIEICKFSCALMVMTIALINVSQRVWWNVDDSSEPRARTQQHTYTWRPNESPWRAHSSQWIRTYRTFIVYHKFNNRKIKKKKKITETIVYELKQHIPFGSVGGSNTTTNTCRIRTTAHTHFA